MKKSEQFGEYQLLKLIGKGGMGEVFLAYDTLCDRTVALKKIRKDLLQFKTMQDRFLKEAKIAAQLTHPVIIPIYAIHKEKEEIYYTMPFVEGETLKEIFKTTLSQEKQGSPLHPIGGSIPALVRIFVQICQAIAYTHSKGFLHRDLKPDNIIIGKYGELFLLDWGLAKSIKAPEELSEEIPSTESTNVTRPGKVVGTLSYMSPEHALGKVDTKVTDIYSLGVILYQILTLQLPFQRPDLKLFRKRIPHETLIDPEEVSPYRDIPKPLSEIAKKCLSTEESNRYQSVEVLLVDLEKYSSGRPEWRNVAELLVDNKNDWEFQENILLAKHIAITRSPDFSEWVTLMLSKASFSGNLKLQVEVTLGQESSGIGLLISVPESSTTVDEGYCFFIGSEHEKGTTLFFGQIELMQEPDLFLPSHKSNLICIERSENSLKLYINEELKLHYVSYKPMAHGKIGLLYRDADFTLGTIHLFASSQNAMVNCLAIPDAFFAKKDYTAALSSYRRIGASFLGRSEGREALFRAGITLLEQGIEEKRSELLNAAFDEFSALRTTSSAPLEYLGKSLIYKAEKEVEEEAKALEFALCKYKKHPLVHLLEKQLLFRLHEAAYSDRRAAYNFALIALSHRQEALKNPEHRKLLESLEANCEKVFFIPDTRPLAMRLAFFLGKEIWLSEMYEKSEDPALLFALLELKADPLLFPALQELYGKIETLDLDRLPEFLDFETDSCVRYRLEREVMEGRVVPAHLPKTYDDLRVISALMRGKKEVAGGLLQEHGEELQRENDPFFPLYGCFLAATQGIGAAKKHLATISHLSYPQIPALLSYYLLGKIDLEAWKKKAFYWERVQLQRQVLLFYTCAGEKGRTEELFVKFTKH